ncbi:MAG: biotin transporter BioY [Clostridia bacterium]
MKNKKTILDITYIACFSALIAVCAWITIPGPVPFTLQTFAVFTALGLLGGKRGTLSVFIYILLGAAGVPVFANFGGGIGVLLGSTGGYIIGFLFSALFIWIVTNLFGDKTVVLAGAMFVGLIICYMFGTAWFMVVFTRANSAITFGATLMKCVVPFVIPDLLKISLALLISKRLKKAIK